MVDRIDDESTWMEFNQTLVELGQNATSARTREAVLDVIEYMFENMRERYLVILNDTIPFLSEMLEDEDEKVEASAKRIVNHVE
jgi:U3 small nucleolar RNA-associated protein 10